MAVAISKPSGGRVDDIRAIRQRLRTFTFSGNYATGGETVTAASLGLKRVMAVIPCEGGIVGAPAGVTGNPIKIDIASTGASFTIKFLEDAAGAAGVAFGQEKTNAEAYIANQAVTLLVLGY